MSKKLMYSFISVLVLSMAGSAWSGASKPSPADGAMVMETWVSLGWTGGQTAASYDVYFGDNLDNVNDELVDTYRGNQGVNAVYFIAGFPGYP